MNFGKYPALRSMKGPNTVAYRQPFNVYEGTGGNTTNWLTGKPYLPNNKKFLNVQKTTNNPTGWLTNSNIKTVSTGTNNARSYTRKGLRYGYNSKNPLGGSKTLYQPKPPYLKMGKHKKRKKLSTKFGGKVITLNGNGKITIK